MTDPEELRNLAASLSLHRLNLGNHLSKLLLGQFIGEVRNHQWRAGVTLREIGGQYRRRYSGNIADRDLAIDRVIKVIEQKLNLDYPKTTPKGGTGKGIWIR
ncbi:MAG: hypothetical protein ACPGFB_16145 [Verrucomicrobiales bacterium]